MLAEISAAANVIAAALAENSARAAEEKVES